METYYYKGINGCASKCGISISEDGNVVMITELKDNPGTSVTNAIEHIATEVCGKYVIPFNELKVIEHYEETSYAPESFELVRFIVDCGELYDPEWRSISKDRVNELMGWQ